jgi:hypothetical protein
MRFIAILAGVGSLVTLGAGIAAAENFQKLSGAQIRAKLSDVRLQMLWDNPSCIGKEVLARSRLRLGS